MIKQTFTAIFDSLPNNIIATVHKDPDFDAIGSLLAFGTLINQYGKTCTLYAPDIDMDQFKSLPSIESIKTTVLDHYDWAFFLDCADISRIYLPDTFPTFQTSVNIDHHQDNTLFATHNLVQDISSVGELLFHLFNALNQPITTQTATQLYAAINFDTGGFRFANTTPTTMKVASDLLQYKIDIAKINTWIHESKSNAYFDDIKIGLTHEYIDPNNPFSIVFIPYSIHQSKESIVNFFRQRESIDTVIICKETAPNEFKLSFRSKGQINVQNIAKQFGGGGHILASGANTTGSFESLKQQLITLTNEAYQ